MFSHFELVLLYCVSSDYKTHISGNHPYLTGKGATVALQCVSNETLASNKKVNSKLRLEVIFTLKQYKTVPNLFFITWKTPEKFKEG